MMDTEINGRRYRLGRLDARRQFHVARRIAPIFQGLGESFSRMPAQNGEDTGTDRDMWSALGPVAEALADMEDEKLDYVINNCLQVVTRVTDQNTNARVMVNGQLMFADMDMAEMVQLAIAVLQENLGDFFNAPPLPSSEVGGQEHQPPSSQ